MLDYSDYSDHFLCVERLAIATQITISLPDDLYRGMSSLWLRHFVWMEDSTQIVGQTACGRATAMALRFNNPISVNVRKAWVSVGWHPPIDEE